MRTLKRIIYHVGKWLGCFYLARRLTRSGLRILAYHGFALSGEDAFRPKLFMDTDLFRQRMEYLVRHKFPVLPLDEALQRVRRGDLPAGATVITFDDGFYSTFKMAVPVIQELRLPATIYTTTYYCIKGNPVFRLVIQYMFWRTTETTLDLKGLGIESSSQVNITNPVSKKDLAWKIINHGEKKMEEEQRVSLVQALGRRLGVDHQPIAKKRMLSLMTTDEIAEAAGRGIDIQLHTHRHDLPLEAEALRSEIHQNRETLEPIVGHRLYHFCYPSGIYANQHFAWLTELDVLSAATCDSGFNYANTNPLLLHRFLDGNNISWIEFEAELSGFAELLRLFRSKFTIRRHGVDHDDNKIRRESGITAIH